MPTTTRVSSAVECGNLQRGVSHNTTQSRVLLLLLLPPAPPRQFRLHPLDGGAECPGVEGGALGEDLPDELLRMLMYPGISGQVALARR